MKCGYWRSLDSVCERAWIMLEWQITTTLSEEIVPSRVVSYVRGEGVQICRRGKQPSVKYHRSSSRIEEIKSL
jgi:hypothetical protein